MAKKYSYVNYIYEYMNSLCAKAELSGRYQQVHVNMGIE